MLPVGGMFGIAWVLTAALAATSNKLNPSDSNSNSNNYCAKHLRVNRALQATHSKRETNQIILDGGGRLLVNGIAVTNPNTRLRVGDQVQFDGETICWQQEDEQQQPHRYIKYNKPLGVICTTDRRVPNNIIDALLQRQHQLPFGISNNNSSNITTTATTNNNNTTVSTEATPPPPPPRRIYPIGRLDANSTGLILLTSNGAIVNPLLRSSKSSKEYHVSTSPRASDRHIQELAAGVMITTLSRVDGGMANVTARTLPCIVERIVPSPASDNDDDSDDDTTLKFILSEGRNRQIRKMVATMNMKVTSLHRVLFSGISLSSNIAECQLPLQAGDWAPLTEMEELAIGARTRNELRSPEEKARRKAKKERNKKKKRSFGN